MAVRNFWIEADVDGRETPLAGGPRSKDDGFTLTVFVRHDGSILTGFTVSGHAAQDGQLRLSVSPPRAEDRFSDKRAEGVIVQPYQDGGFDIITRR